MGHRLFSSPTHRAMPLAALVLAASLAAPGNAATPAGDLFEKLSGDWKGGGTVTPAKGDPMKVACKATYKVTGSNLTQNLRCAGTDYRIDAVLKLTDKNGKIRGSWNEKTYDANGNVIVETDARGKQTHYIYDKAGNVAAKIDALRYVTLWEHNAAGQVTQEKRYAAALPSSVLLQSASALQDVRDALGASDLRQVSYTYNKLGWMETQTIHGVESGVLNSTTHQAHRPAAARITPITTWRIPVYGIR